MTDLDVLEETWEVEQAPGTRPADTAVTMVLRGRGAEECCVTKITFSYRSMFSSSRGRRTGLQCV